MDQYSSSDEVVISVTPDDPDQMIEILHEFFESGECGRPYDLSPLPRKNAIASLDPVAHHHFGVKNVSCIPSNPVSFEELKRRQEFPRARRWFIDDFTTYPLYAISSNTYKTLDEVFFPFDFHEKPCSTHRIDIKVEEDINEVLTTSYDDNFFDAFDNEFKDILLVGEMSDLSVTVTTALATYLSHGIDSYQKLRTDAEKKWQLYSVKEEDEENIPSPSAAALPSQIRRSRAAASISTASSLTSASQDSSETEYYEARAVYFDEDARFDNNGMTPGYHQPAGHLETPLNNYTISALLAKAKSMLVDQQAKRIQENVALERARDLLNQLQNDISSPHMEDSSISDDFAPPAVVACDNSLYSAVSEVSNSSSRRVAMSRNDVKELLTKLEEESQKRRTRLGLY